MTPDARRSLSNFRLRVLGVPIAEHLPLIEDESEIELRSPEEVLRRLVALWAVAGAANMPEVSFFCEYVKNNGLGDWLSDTERAFLFSANPDRQQRVHCSWQVEPLFFLSWCAGLVSELELPRQQSDVGGVLDLFPRPGAEDLQRLREAITVRPKVELLNWADLLYRAHWAVREADLRRREAPAGLVPGAVMEWHKAANWMIRYEDEEDWDNVPTDT